ncbi:MAG: YihA family ribosome biogenesis GTP-binding protein [Bacteroidales bacterium]|jgi:GTP-binding protein|nr:YihA family ribosome biogenesis GTP-binding protein [Bacteroidales bacterium]NLH24351.1 YihA family ribosome biogenesis GTP-binding protein [Bacteroidales bacterium]
MEIKEASFLSATIKVDEIPAPGLEEFAFIGRSNVGKSSLINMLCNRRKLAHTSSTPGKTQCINRFLIDKSWIITDLPGYGFAKVSKTKRAALEAMIQGYIRRAPNMTLLFVLLDSRHPLQQIDLDFLLKLGNWQIPIALVLTKSDKLSKTALEKQAATMRKSLSHYWEPLPPFFIVSSLTGEGRKELLDYIGSIRSENL